MTAGRASVVVHAGDAAHYAARKSPDFEARILGPFRREVSALGPQVVARLSFELKQRLRPWNDKAPLTVKDLSAATGAHDDTILKLVHGSTKRVDLARLWVVLAFFAEIERSPALLVAVLGPRILDGVVLLDQARIARAEHHAQGTLSEIAALKSGAR